VALGYVRHDAAQVTHANTHAQVALWGRLVPVQLFDHWTAAR
jgi:hypothetical protein